VFREVLGIELAEYDKLFADHVKGIVGGYRMVPSYDELTLLDLQERVKKDPKDAEAWTKLAWARFQRKRTVDAGAALEKARSLTPDAPRVILLEGRMAASSGRPDLAEKHFQRFLDAGEDDYEVRLFLAQLAVEERDPKAAAAHWEAAKRCFPFGTGKGNPYVELAKLHEGANDAAAALAEYEAFARIDPENYGVRAEKLKPAYLQRKDLAAIVRVCEEMIDISPFGANRDEPPDLDLHRDFADALLGLGRREEALRELRVQVELVERLPEEDRLEAGALKDRLRLGELLLELGKPEDALEQALAALRLAPDDAEAILLRARAREAGGDR
jgi:tetratricopeptide (TPR) repeat protein